MQHIIEEIKDNFRRFIESGEKTVMIVEAAAEESLLLLKTLSMLEEDELSPDIFASHTESFDNARNYVNALFENQAAQIEAVNEELEKRNESLLEEFPPELARRDMVHHERLAGIVAHVRRNVPAERKVVWVFFPLEETAHEEAFANLLRHLAFETFDERIENTKIIVRDTPSLALKRKLWRDEDSREEDAKEDTKEESKISLYRAELDLPSIFKKIEQQSKNPEAQPDERAQNMMLMAGVDIAEKRFDKALERNKSVLGYFEKSKQKQKQSVVHNNIGDIYYLQGKFPDSQTHYEKAVTIAMEEKSQPLVIYQSINLGNSLFMQEKYDESLIYYQSAEKLAAINQVLIQQIQAMEKVGDTQRAQGNLEDALKTWNEAADICRENKYKLGLVGILERLEVGYEEAGEDEKSRKAGEELEACKEDVRQVEPAMLGE